MRLVCCHLPAFSCPSPAPFQSLLPFPYPSQSQSRCQALSAACTQPLLLLSLSAPACLLHLHPRLPFPSHTDRAGVSRIWQPSPLLPPLYTSLPAAPPPRATFSPHTYSQSRRQALSAACTRPWSPPASGTAAPSRQPRQGPACRRCCRGCNRRRHCNHRCNRRCCRSCRRRRRCELRWRACCCCGHTSRSGWVLGRWEVWGMCERVWGTQLCVVGGLGAVSDCMQPCARSG